MKDRKDSSFSCLMLIKARVVRFYVQLAANCLPNREHMVETLSMKSEGGELNHANVFPFKDKDKALYQMGSLAV